MNTEGNARTGTTHGILALLRMLAAVATLALTGRGALAADSEAGIEPALSVPSPAAQLVAQSLRETVLRQASAARAQQRLGMHLVVRLAVVDVVSHPDSGEVDLAARSRLLGRPIARKPLAVGVTWRF
ncbi:MAG: hypothetical protein JNN03_23550 [Rubrivivax sp.]|nr:hypothetical protein [Rubrivivax sp.]